MKKPLPETKKKKGRPKKYQSDAERQQAYRDRQRENHRRLDVHIDSSAAWRLDKLAQAWGCSRGRAIQRLLMEADKPYEKILFPDLDEK